jgi:hypothetical protein
VSCPVPHSASQNPSTFISCRFNKFPAARICIAGRHRSEHFVFGFDMVLSGGARGLLGALLLCSSRFAQCLRYDPSEADWNLNTNQAATSPLDYSGTWQDHTFFPSPENWRFPFYTLFLDRFVNGDPSNDDINGTLFEQDIMGTTMRHGGDLAGLVDTLDYIQGMGIKVLGPHSQARSGADLAIGSLCSWNAVHQHAVEVRLLLASRLHSARSPLW